MSVSKEKKKRFSGGKFNLKVLKVKLLLCFLIELMQKLFIICFVFLIIQKLMREFVKEEEDDFKLSKNH